MEPQNLEVEETKVRSALATSQENGPSNFCSTASGRVSLTVPMSLSPDNVSGCPEAAFWVGRAPWRVLRRWNVPSSFLRLSKSTSQPISSHLTSLSLGVFLCHMVAWACDQHPAQCLPRAHPREVCTSVIGIIITTTLLPWPNSLAVALDWPH